MRAKRLLVALFSMLCFSAAQQSTEYVDVYLKPFPGPQVYKDSRSRTLLYVETDGRHVAAISGDGKLLWNRDPFTDAHLSFYRTEKPQIVYMGSIKKSAQIDGGKPEGFVGIRFNSSQFGLLRISSGEFQFQGQD